MYMLILWNDKNFKMENFYRNNSTSSKNTYADSIAECNKLCESAKLLIESSLAIIDYYSSDNINNSLSICKMPKATGRSSE